LRSVPALARYEPDGSLDTTFGDGGGPQLNRLRNELDERLYRAGLAD
jgi:hypothetical protein